MLVSVALLLLLALCGEVGVAVGGDGYHSASTIVRTFGERASFDQLALQIIVGTQRECAAINQLAVDGAGCAFVIKQTAKFPLLQDVQFDGSHDDFLWCVECAFSDIVMIP